MFSNFLHSLAVFLFSYNVSSDPAISLQIHQQIQIELEQAAAEGMVSTRSQDKTPIAGASQNVVRGTKRKTDKGGEDFPAQSATKRRRGSARLNGDAEVASNARKRSKPRRSGSAKIANDNVTQVTGQNESIQEPSLQGSPTTAAPLPEINSDRTLGDAEDKAIEVGIMKKPNNTKNKGSEVLDAHDRVKPGAEGTTRSIKGRARKEIMKDSEGIANVHKNGANVDTKSDEPTISLTTVARPTHKRFGSEEIEIPGTISTIGIEEREESREDLSEDEGVSGDEAPETVTASAGFDEARISALGAAKVAARQKAEKKLKRREHGQRLRLQANSAKESQYSDKSSTKARRTKGSSAKVTEADSRMPVEGSESVGEAPKITEEKDGKPATTSTRSRKTTLPLLLPDEILAAEPVIPAPRRPFSNSKVATGQKRKFLDPESKPPKDIKCGDVTIRVLQDKKPVLPPKSSRLGKSLRESWLAGRQGFEGKIRVPRRKLSDGFVRRRGGI